MFFPETFSSCYKLQFFSRNAAIARYSLEFECKIHAPFKICICQTLPYKMHLLTTLNVRYGNLIEGKKSLQMEKKEWIVIL